MAGPDFICIGLPKTGTGWIYNTLKLHTEVNTTNAKELSYFSVLNNKTIYKNNIQFLQSKHWCARQRRLFLLRRYKAYFKMLPNVIAIFKSIHWDLKYLFGEKTDEWYLSLFDYSKMTCDISPSYCTLNKDEIKHVYEICPDSKIILFVRNPLDRAWSHIKMKLFRKEGYQDFSKIDNKVILDSISKEYLDIFSPYPIYNKWASVYPDKQIYVAYYEEMKDDRSLFLRNLFSFLELDVGEIKEVEKKSISKRNKSKFDEFPPEIKLHLSKLVAQHFEDATKFDSPYATEWMNSFKKTVETK